jgi:hypothetical protein
MKTKIIVAIAFVAVLGLSAGFFLYQKPAQTVVTGEADFSLEASTLFHEYNTNEELANQKYLNKIISVHGEVTDVTVNAESISVTLGSSDPLAGVSCEIPVQGEKPIINAGDVVRIKGLCTGKLMDVVLTKCALEK